MALRELYVVICPQDLRTFIYEVKRSQRDLWPLSKTTDWFRLFSEIFFVSNRSEKTRVLQAKDPENSKKLYNICCSLNNASFGTS